MNAAVHVFDLLIDWNLGRCGYNLGEVGVTTIRDLAALAKALDVDEADLRGHPLSFVDGDDLIVPWETTEMIVQRATRLKSPVILADVENKEEEFRRHAMYGENYVSNWTKKLEHMEAEYFIKANEEPDGRPMREVLRRWCGAEAAAEFDELKELRDEVRRLGKLIERAIKILREGGLVDRAAALERELGVPVDDVRKL